MKSIFISYSRKDQDFVFSLSKGLSKHGLQPWVDSQEIHISQEWKKAICYAIETATVFIFILSPESLYSPACKHEIAHAQKWHKLILLVLRRPVGPLSLPGSFLYLQTISCQEQDNFERAVKIIVNIVTNGSSVRCFHAKFKEIGS